MNKCFRFLFASCCALVSLVAQAQTELSNFSGNLVGVWKISEPATEEQKTFQLKYHLISRDSVLVETYGNPAKQTTATVYHRDGKNLMATHYCARGNQPRLTASPLSGEKNIEFNFKDITNLNNKNDPHMVRMKFTFLDKNRFQREEVYLVNGKEELSTMALVRVN